MHPFVLELPQPLLLLLLRNCIYNNYWPSRQQAWVVLEAECAGHARLPPKKEYRGALRWRIRKRLLLSQGHKGAAEITNQMLGVHASIRLEAVVAALDHQCCSQCCLTAFVDDTGAVRNWRILWHSAPRSVKHESLTAFIRVQYEEYCRRPVNEFHTKYSLLGIAICKPGFTRATGIGLSGRTKNVACVKPYLVST